MTRLTFLKNPPAGDESGFTLLEAMIAMCLFAIGILATVSMQTSSLNANKLARQNTEAASFAASVIEDLHPLSYELDAEVTEGSHNPPAQDQYNITYNVQRDAILDNTMVIQVTVNWTDKGVPKSINLISIKPDII